MKRVLRAQKFFKQETMTKNIQAATRGTKMLIASLSIAASISGWAWLTAQPPAQTNSADANVSYDTAPRSNLPDLQALPVRGVDGASAPNRNFLSSRQASMQTRAQPVRKTRSSK